MKKQTKVAIPLLLVLVMLITALGVFVGTANAATTGEATLSTRTVTYGSNGYATAFGTAKTENGDFATLAATLATLAPTADTQYTLKLNQDVTLETSVSIVTNEFAEVIIDLNGYTLTTKTAGDAIVVSGNGDAVRLYGDYDAEGNRGRVVYSQSAGAVLKVASGSTVRTTVRNLDADLTAMTGGAAFVALGGELSVHNSLLTTAAAADIDFVSATAAVAEVKVSRLTGAAATAVSLASGAKAYLHDSVITTAVGVESDATASAIVSVDSDITSPAPFVLGNADTTLHILGGRVETTGAAIVSGTFAKENVGLWYGSGDMRIVGEDPAAYTVQAKCSFAKNSSDEWVMSCSYSTYEAMGTKVVLGSAPTVSYNTLTKLRSNLVGNGTIATTTAHIITLLKDASAETYKNQSFTATEYFNYVIDYNGYTATLTTEGSWNFDTYGNMYIHYDGASADGKVGKIITNSKVCMLFRTRVKSGSMGANLHTLINLTSLECELAKYDEPSAAAPICIQQGELIADGFDVKYTGSLAKLSAAVTFGVYQIGSSTYADSAVAHINNFQVVDVSGNEHMSIVAISVTEKGKGRLWVENMVADNVGAGVEVPAGCLAVIKNSEIKSKSIPYSSGGTLEIYDTKTVTGAGGTICSSGAPIFYYGTGKSVVLTGGAELNGLYTTEEGYVLFLEDESEGRYTVKNADNIITPTVTMPAVFAKGMVLQRNKEINIFGYCDKIGVQVQVKLAGKTAVATVDENGEWCATLEPLPAMFDQTLDVKPIGENVSGKLIRFTDVNIGEIWVMSGQSNGDLKTIYMEDLAEYYTLSDSLKNVRMYRSSTAWKLHEQKIGSGTWYEAAGKRLANKDTAVTSIGYVMAAKLAAELGDDVPVAIMHMAQGSCKIKTWVDYKRLSQISPSSTREYEYWVEQDTLPEKAYSTNAVGTVMYNNVIAPLYNYEIAGVLWYQGEGDTGYNYFASRRSEFLVDGEAEDADNTYTEFFYAVEDSFREAFGNDPNLPFYVMQLSPFVSTSYETPDVYNLKMEQYDMCKNEPNTHLVSLGLDGAVIGGSFFDNTLDPNMGDTSVSGQGFIHPIRKSTVGIRAADMILANEYGIRFADVYTYPTPEKATVGANGKVTVTFDTELQYTYGVEALGFELYDGTKWVKATGKIDGKTVVLAADGVTAPTSVRYGCGEMLMELGDGTIIEVVSGKTATASGTLTVTYNGQKYLINGNTTDMIRSLDYGNITNASGIPLPLFKLEIVSE